MSNRPPITTSQSQSRQSPSKGRVPPAEQPPSSADPHWHGGVSRMQKFSLYETATRFYLVGMDLKERRFRVLKIERTAEAEELRIADDGLLYSKKEINQLLDAVDDGNKVSGGLRLRSCTWGLLGLIRFTGTYYMLLVTKRSQVAVLGGHYLYQIDGTELVPLSPTLSHKTRLERAADEARFLSIMNNLDLTRSFYFSYSYDLTRTLQFNLAKAREAVCRGAPENVFRHANSMFEWNHYLLQPFIPLLDNPFDWCFPIIHGYVDQATISVFGRLVYVTLIARRSRYFAGARFLKRGANDLGYVANDVETEQIVSDTLTTSFHAPGPTLFANPGYTAYVQHRGSIPLYWLQDSNGVAPKPDIEMHLVDPFYSAAALHFDNLFERYGAPVYVLNLVKARERTPRESKLLREYTDAVRYLNQFLPADQKIIYKAFDMSRAAKARDQDVITSLEAIAEDIIPRTGLFCNAATVPDGLRLQNGVARTNCIDCLDRTNAAQFVVGKRALGYQLHALGIIDTTSVEYDTDAVNIVTSMWHHHGDMIAVQYGGSQLVNTMATYRKTNQWTSQSRDMVESFRRYYNNSFLDAQRQEAYNLFLGHYVYVPNEPLLWDLSTDYYLHHSNPKQFLCLKKRSYINWFTPEYLQRRHMPEMRRRSVHRRCSRRRVSQHAAAPELAHDSASFPADLVGRFDDYWMEYYRPLSMTHFQKTFSYKMKSSARYLPVGHAALAASSLQFNMSPFVPRVVVPSPEASDAKKRSSAAAASAATATATAEGRREVIIREPGCTPGSTTTSTTAMTTRMTTPAPSDEACSVASFTGSGSYTVHRPLQQWLQSLPPSSAPHAGRGAEHEHALKGIIKPSRPDPSRHGRGPVDEPPARARALPGRSGSGAAANAMDEIVRSSLHPTVSPAESEEYERYVNYPLRVPLVVTSSCVPPPTYAGNPALADLLEYMDHRALEDVNLDALAEENLLIYNDYLKTRPEGLSVLEEDHLEKRYRLYENWAKGKSVLRSRLDSRGLGRT
ncbi:phosphatidylinositol-3,5-bisphosphate 5-phosphatase [Ascosphaera acerosa]|nr:phosphatidylinositol-3,5-bisphosphate 5-phosphatase [Ascosphaera acerosa]